MTDPRDKPISSASESEHAEPTDAIIGVALKRSLVVFAVIAISVGAMIGVAKLRRPATVERKSELAAVQVREAPPVEIPTTVFTDVTQVAGIDFVHENGAYGQKLLPETMGGGCAFFDFDGDGHQDLLLVNSQRWSWDPRGSVDPPSVTTLYRNDGTGHFQDVTSGSGLDIEAFGMGVAVGDYDRDGRPDVYLSAVGANHLFHNLGGGKFLDITAQAGVAGRAQDWGSSCGWFDYDRDGDLDLFVCNYVAWSREFDEAQDFQLTGGGRAYGRPQNFGGSFPYLFRNDGDGRFEDVSESAGLQIRNPATQVPMAKSLGVALADFDHDGWIDIVVANDTVQNFLFRNRGDGSFDELGAQVGVAFDMNGNARGAMGIDVARFRNNDALGVAIGNFANEMTAMYVTYQSQMQFMDEAISTGLGPRTRTELTFGVCYFDYDLDGNLDLLAANGHLEEEINRVQSSQHYEQPPQLFWNCGAQHETEFLPVPAEYCGDDFVRPMVGRGASFADIDLDGDLDVLLTSIGRPPRLLRNDQQLGHHWLRLELLGTACNRDAVGARIEARLGDRTLYRQVMPTRSYLSQVELPVTLGLAAQPQVDLLTVFWPDGTQQSWSDVKADQIIRIEQSVDATR